MRILHLNFDDSIGGASRAVIRLNTALQKNKQLSKIFVIRNKLSSRSIISFSDLYYYINFVKRTLSYLIKKIHNFNDVNIHRSYNIFNNSKLVNYINKSKFDIVHLHWINGEMISISDLHKLKKPLVWTFHDLWPVLPSSHTDCLKLKQKFLEKSILFTKKKFFKKKNISIIVPSQMMFRKVKRKNIINNNNLTIIPNPIDINFWKPQNKIASREKLDLPLTKKIIGYNISGINDDFIKGTDIFIKIFEKLKKNNNILFLLFGSMRKDLDSKFKRNVINMGKINNNNILRDIYNSTDLIISTSRFESFGQVILEAQCCEKWCVAFNKTGIDDIIKNNKTGFLVEQFKINTFINRIKKYLNNSNSLDKLVTRKKIAKKFNYNNVSLKHEKNYKKVIKDFKPH